MSDCRYFTGDSRAIGETRLAVGAIFGIVEAIRNSLADARREIRAKAVEASPCPAGDPVADGMLRVLTRSPLPPAHEIRLDGLDRIGLTVRARKAIMKLLVADRDATLAAVTEDALFELRNCGPTTIRELMRWKARLLGHDEGDAP